MTDLAADRDVTGDFGVTAPRVRRVRTPLFALRDAAGTLAGRDARSDAPALKGDTSAVDGLDLDVRPREIVGVLGESGAGDVALMRLAAGLRPLERGHRWWRGRDVTHAASRDARAARHRIQPILGGRIAALNPRLRVVDAVGDAPVGGRIIGSGQKVEYVALHLNRVGIDPMLMRRFPQQFTAGQRVRIGIARALAVRPEMLVWDDVFSALDATERAQLVNLALDLRSGHELTYLLACRDPAIVGHVADRVIVLHAGRIAECGPTAQLLAAPAHPYTRALLGTARLGSAGPRAIGGAAPDAGGCAYRWQCAHAAPACRETAPPLVEIAAGHRVACHHVRNGESRAGTGQAT